MSIRSLLTKHRNGFLIVFGSSALGGGAYRYASKSASSDTSLNPESFVPYKILSKESVSATSSIFELYNPNHVSQNPAILKDVYRNAVWSIQIKQPQLQIARAYTPLPPPIYSDSEDEAAYKNGEQLRLLIRKEHGGEVSNFLHRLPEDATLELRGPNVEYEIPEHVKEVIFLAGGTGIAPAMQVAHAMRDRPGTKMHILWANRKREECEGGKSDTVQRNQPTWTLSFRSPFGLGESVVTQDDATDTSKKGAVVKELEALKRSSEGQEEDRLQVDYFVDGEKRFISPSAVSGLLQPAVTNGEARPDGSKLVLISGPDGFVKYWAGEKVWAGGQEEQGPLRGILSKLDHSGWKIWKL